jgi:CubicO group peptidase (beta-lactamase class C family)
MRLTHPRDHCSLSGLLIVMWLLWAGLPSIAGGQQPPQKPEIPDSPAGESLKAFLEAFNSGDERAFREFIVTSYRNDESDTNAVERRLGAFKMLHGDLGGVELHSIREAEELMISVLAKAVDPKQFEWVNMTFELEAEPPHRLIAIMFRPGEDPSYPLPEGKLTDEEIADWLEEFIDELAGDDKFSGAVLVAKNGRPFFKKASGLASKRFSVPNNVGTKFNLGSANKMFTAIAIAQLAQQGKLSFDDTVIKYLPDYPNKEFAEKVTIHQLLTHTSGLDSYWAVEADKKWTSIRTVAEICSLFVHDTLLFEPGERFQYSNSGPIVLGLIIERITGMDYYEYVRKNIYEPAGMTSTDCYEMDLPVPNLAIGYTRAEYDAGESPYARKNNLFSHTVKGGPGGGGFSTVEDMLKFADALNLHKLLNPEYTEIVTTGKVEMSPDEKYCYLFGEEFPGGHRAIGHNGGAPGINAFFKTLPDLGYTVVVLSNYDPPSAEMVGRKIIELITR